MNRYGRVPTYHKKALGVSFAKGVASYAQLGAEGGGLAMVGQALTDLGNTVGRQADQERETARAAYLARMELNLDQQLTGIAQQTPDDLNAFKVRAQKTREAWLEQFDGSERDMAEIAFDRKVLKLGAPILDAQRTKQRNQSKADLLTLHTHSMDKATAAMRAGDMDTVREETLKLTAARESLFSGDMISPKEYVALGETTAYQLTRNKILGEGDRAKGGGLESYRAFIDGVKENDHLHPDDASRIVGELEADYRDMAGQAKAQQAEVDAQAKAERAAKIAALDLAVSRGQAGYKELEQARQGGLFDKDPDKFTSLSKAVDGRYEKDRKKAEGAALVNSALLGETVLDARNKDHKKAADDTYAAWTDQEAIKALPMEVRNSATVDFVAKTGILPERAASDIRTGMMGPAETQVQTADLVARMDALPGDHLKGVGEHSLAKSRLIASMTRVGVPAEDAVKRATELTDPTKREMFTARAEAFKDVTKFTASDVADHFDGWLPWQWDPDVPNTVAAQLVADINGLFERQYMLTGDEDLAKTYALKKIGNTWGVTSVDGSERLTKYPPEAFYGIGGDNDWMQSQLQADLTEQGLPEKTKLDDILLEADDRTAREASTGRPTYQVLVRGKDGAWEPFTTKDGVVRWSPDATTARDEKTKRKLKRAKVMRDAARLEDDLYGGVPFAVGVQKGLY